MNLWCASRLFTGAMSWGGVSSNFSTSPPLCCHADTIVHQRGLSLVSLPSVYDNLTNSRPFESDRRSLSKVAKQSKPQPQPGSSAAVIPICRNEQNGRRKTPYLFVQFSFKDMRISL